MIDQNKQSIQLTLSPDGVAAPAQLAGLICREVVDLYFDALAKADLSKKPANSGESSFFRLDLQGQDFSAEQRRAIHENWILVKAFQDLMRGVRASLEEAFLFLELATAGTLTVKSSSTLDDVLAPYRHKAAGMKFPPLLAAVNSRLERQLEFSDAYRSMQLARNCLEHRNGIVGTADVQHDGIMRLQFPRLVAFIERNGEQMELHSGMAVEAGENILMKLEVKIRQFALGERLSLSAADFDEIAFACSHFAGELARSLPGSTPTPAMGSD